VDSLIIIPNQRLINASSKNTGVKDAFAMADNVLRQAVQGIADIIVKPGYINVDFADVRAVMSERGLAMMESARRRTKTPRWTRCRRPSTAPSWKTNPSRAARGVLLNFTHASTLPIYQLSEASKDRPRHGGPRSQHHLRDVIEDEMAQSVRVTVIATGFDGAQGSEAVEEAASVAQLRPYTPKPAPRSPHPKACHTSARGRSRRWSTRRSFRWRNLSEEVLDIPTFLRRQAD